MKFKFLSVLFLAMTAAAVLLALFTVAAPPNVETGQQAIAQMDGQEVFAPNVATANVDTGQTAVVAQNTTAQDIGQNEAIQIEVQNDDAMALAQHQKTTMANTVAQTAPATAEACFTVVA